MSTARDMERIWRDMRRRRRGDGARLHSGPEGRAPDDGSDASPEPGKIKKMFDGIAASYDRMNDLMTGGLHHRWREMGAMLAQVEPGDSVLDVCCGTGDFAFELKRAVGPEGRVVGVDVSEEMLEIAREKSGRNQLYVEFREGDLLHLPFPDGGLDHEGTSLGFDACTVGFGIRNVSDVVRAFSEMRRVCRPGAKVVCLEITQSHIPGFKQFYQLWFDRAVPVLGRVVSRDKDAYTYLPESVKRFPDPKVLKTQMELAGLRNVRYELLAGGIIAIHHAWV